MHEIHMKTLEGYLLVFFSLSRVYKKTKTF